MLFEKETDDYYFGIVNYDFSNGRPKVIHSETRSEQVYFKINVKYDSGRFICCSPTIYLKGIYTGKVRIPENKLYHIHNQGQYSIVYTMDDTRCGKKTEFQFEIMDENNQEFHYEKGKVIHTILLDTNKPSDLEFIFEPILT